MVEKKDSKIDLLSGFFRENLVFEVIFCIEILLFFNSVVSKEQLIANSTLNLDALLISMK